VVAALRAHVAVEDPTDVTAVDGTVFDLAATDRAATQQAAIDTAPPDEQVTIGAGSMSAPRLLGIRTVDLLVHSWDLAVPDAAERRVGLVLLASLLGRHHSEPGFVTAVLADAAAITTPARLSHVPVMLMLIEELFARSFVERVCHAHAHRVVVP